MFKWKIFIKVRISDMFPGSNRLSWYVVKLLPLKLFSPQVKPLIEFKFDIIMSRANNVFELATQVSYFKKYLQLPVQLCRVVSQAVKQQAWESKGLNLTSNIAGSRLSPSRIWQPYWAKCCKTEGGQLKLWGNNGGKKTWVRKSWDCIPALARGFFSRNLQ